MTQIEKNQETVQMLSLATENDASQGAAKDISKNLLTTLKEMRCKMRATNVLFHCVRNNPSHRDRYYIALIAAVGLENWQYVPSALRMAWESGRNSFDALYGLVKTFNKNDRIINAFASAALERKRAEEQKAKKQNQTDNTANEIITRLKASGSDFTAAQLVQITETLLGVLVSAKKQSQQEQAERDYIEQLLAAVPMIHKP